MSMNHEGIDSDDTLRREARPLNACQHCGSVEFLMLYTETAWATVTDQEGESEPEVLLDGHNVESYMLERSKCECASCHKPHKWINAPES